MKGLARFEEFAERMVEGSFARLLGSRLQPVEIAKRLARVMDDRQTIAAGKVFVPNRYQVFLHPETLVEFASFQTALEEELATYLAETAQRRQFAFIGVPRVSLRSDPTVKPNVVQIEAHITDLAGIDIEGPTELKQATRELRVEDIRAATPNEPFALVLDDRVLALTQSRITLGRSLDNDIVLDDPSVSRRHAVLVFQHGYYTLRDLNSSYGTQVNGQPIREAVLNDGDRLTVAAVNMVFRRGHRSPAHPVK